MPLAAAPTTRLMRMMRSRRHAARRRQHLPIMCHALLNALDPLVNLYRFAACAVEVAAEALRGAWGSPREEIL
eukprot:1794768-Pyramimonas_sp.AAC.1